MMTPSYYKLMYRGSNMGKLRLHQMVQLSVLVCTLSSLKMGYNRAVVVHLKAFLNQSVQGHRPVQPIQKL